MYDLIGEFYYQHGQLDARKCRQGRAGRTAAGARNRGGYPGARLQILRQGAGYGNERELNQGTQFNLKI